MSHRSTTRESSSSKMLWMMFVDNSEVQNIHFFLKLEDLCLETLSEIHTQHHFFFFVEELFYNSKLSRRRMKKQ